MKLSLKAPATNDQIKKEVEKLSAEIDKRKAEIKMLWAGVKHYQDQCDHPGQVTGRNEREGSWGSPCPICGYSY